MFSLCWYRAGMINRKPFGKLGKRGLARVSTGLDATLVLPGRLARCRMTDISRTGCKVQVSEPVRAGVTVLVRIERVEEIGTVVWTNGTECGVKFGRPIAIQALARIRWMVEHGDDQERRMMASTTAIWR
jgi:PilZ domain